MTRKTQIAWMSVGALLCLFSLVLTIKLRDGNKVVAREESAKQEGAQESPTPLPPEIAENSKPMADAKPPEAKLQEPLPTPEIVLTGASEPEKPPTLPEPKAPAPPPEFKVMPPPEFKTPPAEIQVAPPTDLKAPPPPEVKAPPTPEPKTPPPAAVEEKPLPPVPSLPEVKPMPVAPSPAPPAPSPTPPPAPSYNSLDRDVTPVSASSKADPSEPPLVLPAGPAQTYTVRGKGETLQDIARRTLGSGDRWNEIARLNPDLKADSVLAFGATLRLPADACVNSEEADAVKPLPALRAKPPAKAKVLPLTGTYSCNLDERKMPVPPGLTNAPLTYETRKILTLPKVVREQLGNCDTVLVSPGPDHCLWLTNHCHLERLAERIEQSPAHEADVRVFKRLYFAQTEKAAVTADGRVTISDRLAQFAGLHQELVLVGIDEHFELWDAARWKQYTQDKSAAARAAAEE